MLPNEVLKLLPGSDRILLVTGEIVSVSGFEHHSGDEKNSGYTYVRVKAVDGQERFYAAGDIEKIV